MPCCQEGRVNQLNRNSVIYVADHLGLVGAAIVRNLLAKGYTNLLLRTHAELDLTSQAATSAFFVQKKPDYVCLAAAGVGGIHANNDYLAEFIRDNLAIQTNIIHPAYENQIKRLLFLGSSCIYPKLAPQPMKEKYLLTGPLEPTNCPYALAKITGIEMCWSYNHQHGTRYLAAMLNNLYRSGDNSQPASSHAIAALIRKFHEAKVSGAEVVVVSGTGTPRQEFRYTEDMPDACVYMMNLANDKCCVRLGSDESTSGKLESPLLINNGVGSDMTPKHLAETMQDVVGCKGQLIFYATKPDCTPQDLMDVSRLHAQDRIAPATVRRGLAQDSGDLYCH